jgi:hypothetical protein
VLQALGTIKFRFLQKKSKKKFHACVPLSEDTDVMRSVYEDASWGLEVNKRIYINPEVLRSDVEDMLPEVRGKGSCLPPLQQYMGGGRGEHLAIPPHNIGLPDMGGADTDSY